MWSSEHAANYMKYFGYLNFEIKTDYRSKKQLTQIVNQFRIDVNEGDIDSEEYHEFLHNMAVI